MVSTIADNRVRCSSVRPDATNGGLANLLKEINERSVRAQRLLTTADAHLLLAIGTMPARHHKRLDAGPQRPTNAGRRSGGAFRQNSILHLESINAASGSLASEDQEMFGKRTPCAKY
jgi:hypothetical protein